MSQLLPALYGASILLANSSIWIFGGNTDIQSNNSYAIDVSKAWKVTSPPLTNIPASGPVFTSRYFSTLSLDYSGSTFWLYGGASKATDLTETIQVAVYNPHLNTWPGGSNGTQLNGTKPPAVFAHSAVRNSKGVVYHYGGSSDLTDTDLSDFWDGPGLTTLDTRTSNFSSVQATPGNPGPMGWHTATLVNDTLMYIIGGLTVNPSDDFPVAVYNTATNSWTHPVNSTLNPLARHGHTAVLTDDGSQIIVYGGLSNTNAYLNDVWTLNLATNQWAQRNTTGPAPQGRAFHNAVLIKNQMIVLFGRSQSPTTTPSVLDTKAWTWITSYDPNYTALPPKTVVGVSTSSTSVSSTPSSTDTDDSFDTIGPFTNTPISAAGIAGIVLAVIAVISVAMVSIVQPRNRIKPVM